MEIAVALVVFFWGGYVLVKDFMFRVVIDFMIRKKNNIYLAFVDVLSESNNESENNLLSKTLFNLIFGAACVVLVLFALDVWLVKNHEGVAGAFGDFFGGVLNPILTFLTFIGLIVTIVVQRHDLRLSRVEYERTAEALTTQSVENTFFNIVELHNKIADNIKFDLSAFGGGAYLEKLTGLKKFLKYASDDKNIASDYYSTYNSPYDSNTSGSKDPYSPYRTESKAVIESVTIFEGRAAFQEILKYLSSDSASPKQIVERYKQIQDEHNHIVGHYFRNLYQVLKMIDKYDESVVSAQNKAKYASILRAQLSTKELALLFVNCLDNVCDKGQFKNYLIKYRMFEHLHCREVKGRFLLGGSTGIAVDRSMLLQYRKPKTFEILDLDKVYGGAFGKNRSVPCDLANKNYKSESAS